ncbi:MAG: DUF721 domain-containing protein [Ignavibacteria bacterium]|nr:DUF721 domain-containing protein [Ignavibacteria bacterium]
MFSSKQRKGQSVFISSEIENVINNLRKSHEDKFSFWKEAMGEKIAGAAKPVLIKNSVLIVKVKDSVWRFELSRRKSEILSKINASRDSKQKIRDIVFK